mgnify:CR=1 FL=1
MYGQGYFTGHLCGYAAGPRMIEDIHPRHYARLLKINEEFVHWLAPMDKAKLEWVLSKATYARQIDDARAVLIGYPSGVDYPDHWNLTWLKQHFKNFFYIDRVIVDAEAHGKGYGRRLYDDITDFARDAGHTYLCCEVNTLPNNPNSHKFHIAQGFTAYGEQIFPTGEKAVRYYGKRL